MNVSRSRCGELVAPESDRHQAIRGGDHGNEPSQGTKLPLTSWFPVIEWINTDFGNLETRRSGCYHAFAKLQCEKTLWSVPS
jgi:hypothetical protein